MLLKTQLTRNINYINSVYIKARGVRQPQLYAKLALLETCGWIEECIDDIVRNISVSKLSANGSDEFVKSVMRKNSGFTYKDHIRNKLLKNLIGHVLIEKIEATLMTKAEYHAMISSLTDLYRDRNQNAHTHLSGATVTVIAPSVTIQHLNNVYNGLKLLERELKKLKYK